LKLFKSKIYIALSLLALLIVIGVFGYMYIANYSFVDAFYMTVITITTVGFGEVHPLDANGKLFTIILILTSITIFGYLVSVISDYFINGKLLEKIKKNKVQKKIKKLKNHTIICGYGRNGSQVVKRLASYNKDCVVIENNKETIKKLDELEILYIKGDATSDEELINAGIDNASSLITTLPSDADNLYVVFSARHLDKKITIVSRASTDSSYHKLKKAGANNIIMPDKLGGEHMASLVVTPDLVEFVERLSIDADNLTNLVQINVEDLPREYLSKSLSDLDIRKKSGCTVIGFKTPDNKYVINPEASIMLQPNSKIIVLGKLEQIIKLRELY